MDKRILFGIMMIAFNGIGVPCFMQGQRSTGIKRIVFGVLTLGVIMVINEIKGIIMGIEILTMPEEEYQVKKGTFHTGIPSVEYTKEPVTTSNTNATTITEGNNCSAAGRTFCPGCGNKVAADENFCPYCGRKIR